MDELTVDEDDGFMLDDSVGVSELKLWPVPVEPTETAEDKNVTDALTEVAEEEDHGVKTLERTILIRTKR